ncbi:MAG: carboxypeptidase regulatory-like domain-containing protein [Candidatus Sumerlaeaceae bacterium]|jgi:hypothetical protein
MMHKYAPWIVIAAVLTLATFMYLENRRLIRKLERVTQVTQVTPPAESAALRTKEQTLPRESTPVVVHAAHSPSPAAPAPSRVLRGLCLDPEHNAIPGVEIVAYVTKIGSSEPQTDHFRTVADQDGQFAIECREGETFDSLRAEREGYAPAELSREDLLSTRFVELVLEPLASCELQVLTTRPDGALDRYAGPATIYVLRREAVSDLAPPRSHEIPSLAGKFVTIGAEEATIQQGRYVLRGYPAGIYKIALVASDEYAESDPFSLNRTGQAVATIVLGSRHRFSGRVLSKSDLQPIAGAHVSLSLQKLPEAHLAKNLTYQTITDSEGRFVFEKVVPSVYVLTIAADGYTTQVVDEVTISAGVEQAEEPVYYLTAGAPALRLRVIGPDGLPAPAKIVLFAIAPSQTALGTRFAETDGSGQVIIENLLPGRFNLIVSLAANPNRQKQQEIVIPERGVQNVSVSFQPTVEVRGVARLAGGEPWGGLLYFVPRGAIGPKTFTKCALDGSFQVELEPREYLVGRADQLPSAQLRVYHSGNTDIAITLK